MCRWTDAALALRSSATCVTRVSSPSSCKRRTIKWTWRCTTGSRTRGRTTWTQGPSAATTTFGAAQHARTRGWRARRRRTCRSSFCDHDPSDSRHVRAHKQEQARASKANKSKANKNKQDNKQDNKQEQVWLLDHMAIVLWYFLFSLVSLLLLAARQHSNMARCSLLLDDDATLQTQTSTLNCSVTPSLSRSRARRAGRCRSSSAAARRTAGARC